MGGGYPVPIGTPPSTSSGPRVGELIYTPYHFDNLGIWLTGMAVSCALVFDNTLAVLAATLPFLSFSF